MAVKANLTKVASINATAREIDFVTRFGSDWKGLMEILGIMRPIRKAPGTQLKAYSASVVLQNSVAEGEEIPYSQATITPVATAEITLEKYAKAVSIEAVHEYGAALAVQRTDAAFRNELTKKVLDKGIAFLQTGTLTGTGVGLQDGVAKAIGLVRNKWGQMHKAITRVAVFVNVLDAYDYLGAAQLTVQNAFGIDYVDNFMGARLILSSDIPQGKIIATPVDNIVLYYVDPSDGDFAQLGLNYRVAGDTNLVGYHAEGNYSHAVGEVYALLGMALFAEYLDGIAVVTVGA